MLWKKSWEPEAVLALIAGILAACIFGLLAAAILHGAAVTGFKGEDSLGTILLGTLSFQGVAVVLGTVFLKWHDTSWWEVLRGASWKRTLWLPLVVLPVVAPVVLGLKALSEITLEKLHWPVADQRAVELFTNAKTPWLTAYLVVFAVVLAPLGEEFFFRGLLFSTAKRFGWPKLGWLGASGLFALSHLNVPTLLPLFVLALALTWLYELTEGLLAPVLAHSLFNAANLLALLWAEKHHYLSP